MPGNHSARAPCQAGCANAAQAQPWMKMYLLSTVGAHVTLNRWMRDCCTASTVGWTTAVPTAELVIVDCSAPQAEQSEQHGLMHPG